MAEGFFHITEFNSVATAAPSVKAKLCWGSGVNQGGDDYMGAAIQNRQTQEIYGAALADNPIPAESEFVWELSMALPPFSGTQWPLRFAAGHEINNMTQLGVDETRDFDVIKSGGGNGETPDMTMWYLLAGIAAVAVIGGGAAYYYMKKRKEK